jgi:diguanylate cyclase (GGDEF)-like protein
MTERRRILLVEDNPGDALLIQQMIGASLDAEAWEVTWVQRLDQAARTLGDSVFEVALLDLSLSDSVGLATCDELLSLHPELPFVVLTGDRDEATGVAAVRRGAQDFLQKGRFDGALLKRVIQYSIERQRLILELRNLALVDPLTGLYNRRGFDTVADQHLRVARRSGKGAFCIFCDVDGLKRINDTHGHSAGDEALCLVAGALRDALRRSDVLARLGGDEFAVLGIETGGAYEDVLAGRIQEALTERTRLASLAFSVDVSLGLARVGADANSNLSDLLDSADRAMYAARGAVRS